MLDNLLCAIDNGLKTLSGIHETPDSPADNCRDNTLSNSEKSLSIALMRVNHCGEVCAQALYSGQSVVAKSQATKDYMQHCIEEEVAHLVWCRKRLQQLQGKTSVLDPLFYTCSFAMGIVTGLLSDKVSLGFIAASEELVAQHLRHHLQQLPQTDVKSLAIVQQMLQDEEAHRDQAKAKGGKKFDSSTLKFMRLMSKLMTATTSQI